MIPNLKIFRTGHSDVTICVASYLWIMYSKQEASEKREAFWTALGRYMRPILSAEGDNISWVNYKTGNPHVRISMEADKTSASIGIKISHPDEDIRILYYEQLRQLKHILEDSLGEEWTWRQKSTDRSGRAISEVNFTLEGVSIYEQTDWSEIISFLKPRLIALDEFWSKAKYTLDALK